MDPTLGFGGGHALHAMRAGLELEAREGTTPDEAADDLAVAAVLAAVLGQDLDLPAAPVGVARVHAKQVTGENRRFIAAGPGADFDVDVRVVARIGRNERQLEFALLVGDDALEFTQLVFGHVPEVGIIARSHRLDFARLPLELAEAAKPHHDGLDARVLHGQIAELAALAADRRVAEQPADFLVAFGQALQPEPDRRSHDSSSI